MKLTTEDFIKKAKASHGDKYDYSKANYINSRTKIEIVCPIHGSFMQIPEKFLNGKGCPQCVKENFDKKRTFTTEDFIKKAKASHGDKYDYSKVNYINSRTKIEIVCPIHGSFMQTPEHHYNGSGCPKCMKAGKPKEKNKKKIFTTEDFIKKAKEVHGDEYDYSKSVYINSRTKIEIVCPVHGSFFQLMTNHLRGSGCTECSKEKMQKNFSFTTEDFIKKAKEIHGDEYDYSKTVYTRNIAKVEIVCPKHGSFFQRADCHLNGQGCPKCKSSNGEREIRKYLKNNNIQFVEQKKFEGCKDKIALSFDFYIPSKNIAIEYNGIQHYKPMKNWGGEERLHLQRHHDWLKRKYCIDNGIKLIVIKYDESANKILSTI